MGRVILGGVLEARGESERARQTYRSAATLFDGVSMRFHAESARLRLGHLLGGEAGAAIVQRAQRYMAENRVADPDRLANIVIPSLTR
jgi:hypothetical protein